MRAIITKLKNKEENKDELEGEEEDEGNNITKQSVNKDDNVKLEDNDDQNVEVEKDNNEIDREKVS